MQLSKRGKSLLGLLLISILLGTTPAIADVTPTYEWISKKAQHRKECKSKYDYCLALKVNQTWIQNCLKKDGEAIYVELAYLNSKGQVVAWGRDQGGTKIKGSLLHFPSANRSVYDSYNEIRPVAFSKVRVESITCVSY